MDVVEGLNAFLSEPYVSRQSLLAAEPCEAVSSVIGVSPKIHDDCSSAVDIWRDMYFSWCDESGVPKATPTMFARAVRSRFGLKSTPCGQRVEIDGRKVQYRVFVDGPYKDGHAGGGRPRSADSQSGDAERVVVQKSPARMSRLDVESYKARERQLEAYVKYGYVSRDGKGVMYDGIHSGISCIPKASDSGFVPFFLEATMRDNSRNKDLSSKIHFTRDVAQVGKDGEWYLQRLPEGECLLAVTRRMPVPTLDGEGVEMLWSRLVMHLRQAGVRHYGRFDRQLDEEFCISQGTMFSDGCLLGLTVSVFDEWTNLNGEVIEREFTFDAPQRDFDYYGTAILSSSAPIGIMGNQVAVQELAARVDDGEDCTATRDLMDGEPSFEITYAPKIYSCSDRVIDYVGLASGRVKELGTYVVTTQLGSKDVFNEEGHGVVPTDDSQVSTVKPERESFLSQLTNEEYALFVEKGPAAFADRITEYEKAHGIHR